MAKQTEHRDMATVDSDQTPIKAVNDALNHSVVLAKAVHSLLDDLLGSVETLEGCYAEDCETALFQRLQSRAYEARRHTLSAMERIGQARGELGL
ncbi:hypothetical protein M8994_17335 [Brucella sp. 21LCYQ03]|nr:hypothetical protein [Brucella sp. 21LCYQ03]